VKKKVFNDQLLGLDFLGYLNSIGENDHYFEWLGRHVHRSLVVFGELRRGRVGDGGRGGAARYANSYVVDVADSAHHERIAARYHFDACHLLRYFIQNNYTTILNY
jgi:hypothetical protein